MVLTTLGQERVVELAAGGLAPKQIASFVGMSLHRLYELYEHLIDEGRSDTLHEVGQALISTAKNTQHPQHVSAAKHVLERLGGADWASPEFRLRAMAIRQKQLELELELAREKAKAAGTGGAVINAKVTSVDRTRLSDNTGMDDDQIPTGTTDPDGFFSPDDPYVSLPADPTLRGMTFEPDASSSSSSSSPSASSSSSSSSIELPDMLR